MEEYKYGPCVSPNRYGTDEDWNRIKLQNLGIETASNVDVVEIRWLIPFLVPVGKLIMLVGEPGSGKSTISMAIAAVITNGSDQTSWPCHVTGGYGHVLISSKEENFADTIRPRAEAAGVNLDRLHSISKINPKARGQNEGINLMLTDHLREFSRRVSTLNDGRGIDLFILDPASQMIVGDIGNNSAIQGAYTQLGNVAEIMDCAVLGIAHTSKSAKGKTALSKIAGPRAVTSVPRSIILTAKIERGPMADGATHVLVLAKCFGQPINYGLTYSIQSVEIQGKDGPIKTSKVVFHGKIDGSPDEVLAYAEFKPGKKESSKLEDAVSFLWRNLKFGPVLKNKILERGLREGISEATMNRAKQQIGIKSVKQSGSGQFSGFLWILPEGREESGS